MIHEGSDKSPLWAPHNPKSNHMCAKLQIDHHNDLGGNVKTIKCKTLLENTLCEITPAV